MDPLALSRQFRLKLDRTETFRREDFTVSPSNVDAVAEREGVGRPAAIRILLYATIRKVDTSLAVDVQR